MSIMNDTDSIRAFSDGLKRASSECKRMARLKKSSAWLKLGEELNIMRLNGEKIYSQRKLTRMALLGMADRMVENMGGEEKIMRGLQ